VNLDDPVTDRIPRPASSELCEVSWRTLVRWEQKRKVPLRSVAAAYIKATLEAEATRRK
jgi:DNA-binding transcriptional regulator YiaG